MTTSRRQFLALLASAPIAALAPWTHLTRTPLTVDNELLKLARRRFAAVVRAEEHLTAQWLADYQFLCGEQWPADIQRGRGFVRQGTDKSGDLIITRIT